MSLHPFSITFDTLLAREIGLYDAGHVVSFPFCVVGSPLLSSTTRENCRRPGEVAHMQECSRCSITEVLKPFVVDPVWASGPDLTSPNLAAVFQQKQINIFLVLLC